MEKFDIESLTVKQVKEMQCLLGGQKESACSHPYKIGENYFIRTVTHYYTGKLERVYAHELVLSQAAWIADTGRFSDALKTGKLNEVEPFPEGEVIIGRGSVIDAPRWLHELPKVQK